MAMMWEIHDGKEQVGPLEEEHVLRMIAAGLPATALVRPDGKNKWKNVRSYAPFALAIDARSAAEAPTIAPAPAPAALVSAPKLARSRVIALGAGLLVICGGVGALVFTRLDVSSDLETQRAKVRPVTVAAPTPTPLPQRPKREDLNDLDECRGTSELFWQCPTSSSNPMPLITFKSTSVETPTVFRISGKLSDYFNYEYRGREKSHYSIDVREDPRSISGRIHVYISRKDPTAEALFELLKDGNPHVMTAELAYNKGSKSTDVARMTRFLCGGWRCDVPH